MEDNLNYIMSFILKAGIAGGVILVIPQLEKDYDNNPAGYRNPSERNLPYEDITLITKDNLKIKGWFIKQNQPDQASTIVFFHENAGNLGARLAYLENYYNSVKANILIVAYRGYSKSEGIPTETGIQYDSQAVMDYIFSRQDINLKKVFVHGRSLGGAVSVYSNYQGLYDIAGLILENTFTSISDMVDSIFPKLAIFKSFVLRNHWTTIDRIGHISKPILFIMSQKDEIVPYSQMVTLYNTAKKSIKKRKYEIVNGSHNLNWSLNPKEYFQKITNFVQEVDEGNYLS